MGISDLGKMMKESGAQYHEPLYYDININDLSQKTFALDIMYYTYHIMSRATKVAIENCQPFEEPPVDHFLRSATEQWFNRFQSVNIIACWDGPNKPMKVVTQEKRKEAEEKRKLDIQNCIAIGDVQNWKRLRSQLLRPTKEQIQIIKDTIEKLGHTNHQCDGEGEYDCCRMEREGKVDGVISEDGDCFAFGANIIIRKIKDNGSCQLYFRDRVIKSMFPHAPSELVQYQAFYVLCCLVGNDFIARVNQRGPARVKKLINKHMCQCDPNQKYDLLFKCVTDPEQKSVEAFETYQKVYDMFVNC